jgi:translocator assembly and maintenance protein 41
MVTGELGSEGMVCDNGQDPELGTSSLLKKEVANE